MDETMYMISKSELKDLLTGYYSWLAVENGGVDNWTWCGESIRIFIQDWSSHNNGANVETIEDIAERELINYDEVI